MPVDERLEAYAELIVRVGANVQPGQIVDLRGDVEHIDVLRATARASYRAGASYVDILYRDPHVRRALIESAEEEILGWSPPWLRDAMASCAGVRPSGRPGIWSLPGTMSPSVSLLVRTTEITATPAELAICWMTLSSVDPRATRARSACGERR